jgi:hypothetical protein
MKWVEVLFSEDVRVEVKGKNSFIVLATAISPEGLEYLTNNNIVGKSYDAIDTMDLCFEVIDTEETYGIHGGWE